MPFAVTPYGYEKQAVGQLIAALGRGARATAATAAGAKDFVKNTYNPGFTELRSSLKNMPRVYFDNARPLSAPVSKLLTSDNTEKLRELTRAYYQQQLASPSAQKQIANFRKQVATLSPRERRDWVTSTIIPRDFQTAAGGNAGGVYTFGGVAHVSPYLTKLRAKQIMRHELLHGHQFNTKNPRSLQAFAGRLAAADPAAAPMRNALGTYLTELNAFAGMSRKPAGQLVNALKFMFDPLILKVYANRTSSSAARNWYAASHGTPIVLGASAVLNNWLQMLRSMLNNKNK